MTAAKMWLSGKLQLLEDLVSHYRGFGDWKTVQLGEAVKLTQANCMKSRRLLGPVLVGGNPPRPSLFRTFTCLTTVKCPFWIGQFVWLMEIKLMA